MTPPDEPGPKELGFETRAIHSGQAPDPTTGAVTTPISLATTFAQEAVGSHRGYEYSRSANPTRSALEECLADLEGATHGLAFSSGLAAEDAILRCLEPGDHVLLPHDAYGGTFRLVDKVWRPFGISSSAVRVDDLESFERGWVSGTKLVWIETPSNPALSVVDIEALSSIAHRHGALLVVDNTFATPFLQRPLSLGADVVIHSTTKYIGGHSDVVGGFLATDDPELAARLAFFQNAAGAVPGPFDCYLVLRGVKTLGVRMERHCANAAVIAAMLDSHPAVLKVHYPGLASHPGHAIAGRQMRGFGGMVSFIPRGGEPAALKVARSTELFTLAESLGAVESLIEHPHRMTHASAADSDLAVDPGLIRLSVGIETVEDLVTDLRQALAVLDSHI